MLSKSTFHIFSGHHLCASYLVGLHLTHRFRLQDTVCPHILPRAKPIFRKHMYGERRGRVRHQYRCMSLRWRDRGKVESPGYPNAKRNQMLEQSFKSFPAAISATRPATCMASPPYSKRVPGVKTISSGRISATAESR